MLGILGVAICFVGVYLWIRNRRRKSFLERMKREGIIVCNNAKLLTWIKKQPCTIVIDSEHVMFSGFFLELQLFIEPHNVLTRNMIEMYCLKCTSSFPTKYIPILIDYLSDKRMIFSIQDDASFFSDIMLYLCQTSNDIPDPNDSMIYLSQHYIEEVERSFLREGVITASGFPDFCAKYLTDTAVSVSPEAVARTCFHLMKDSGSACTIQLAEEEFYVSTEKTGDEKLARLYLEYMERVGIDQRNEVIHNRNILEHCNMENRIIYIDFKYVMSATFYHSIRKMIEEKNIITRDIIVDYCFKVAPNFKGHANVLIHYLQNIKVILVLCSYDEKTFYCSYEYINAILNSFLHEGAVTVSEFSAICEEKFVTSETPLSPRVIAEASLGIIVYSKFAHTVELSDLDEALYVSDKERSDSKLVRKTIRL